MTCTNILYSTDESELYVKDAVLAQNVIIVNTNGSHEKLIKMQIID